MTISDRSVTLAEAIVPNATLGVDEVKSGPVMVGEGAPDLIVVIDRDRPIDAHRPGGTLHVVEVVLKYELRRVHTDHHESLVLVSLSPCAHERMRAQPVDACVSPELDKHDLAAQASRG